MTNVLQSAPLQTAQAMLRNQPEFRKLILFRKPTKDGETGITFVIYSLIGKLYLFNMLIINSLNRRKRKKCSFKILFFFALHLKSFI
jgi:hypothetical protein